jgi:hypothetical protein
MLDLPREFVASTTRLYEVSGNRFVKDDVVARDCDVAVNGEDEMSRVLYTPPYRRDADTGVYFTMYDESVGAPRSVDVRLLFVSVNVPGVAYMFAVVVPVTVLVMVGAVGGPPDKKSSPVIVVVSLLPA